MVQELTDAGVELVALLVAMVLVHRCFECVDQALWEVGGR